MTVTKQAFADRWHDFWSPPDQLLIDAGASGEVVVARIRLFITFLLLAIPLTQVMTQPARGWGDVGLLISSGALLLAAILFFVVNGRLYRPWLGFVTSVIDVTLVSSLLAVFLVIGPPHVAVNSRIIYPIYFLAIGATALRYDARTSALTGLIAVLQYAIIVAYADTRWTLNDPAYAPFEFGMFSWGAQYGKLMLLGCAGLISTVIVRRTQHLRWLSASDPLTGLMNRGFFDERIVEEEIRTKRYKRPLTVAMADIDHFKRFNDTHGHAAGDEALRIVTAAVRAAVRRTDLVARYGGEEFVIAFPETPIERAMIKAEDIRRAVENTHVLLRGSRGVARVSVSIGVASWPVDGDDVRAVIEVADRRLYQAKQRGRNQVVGPGTEKRVTLAVARPVPGSPPQGR